MNAVVSSSTYQANIPAYNAFRSLDQNAKLSLLESITVLDSAPQFDDVDTEMHRALYFAAKPKFFEPFSVRVKGWWLNRVISHLTKNGQPPILSEEVDSEIRLLSRQFEEDSLPVDEDIMRAAVDASGYEDRTFVHQLRLIGVNDNRILMAMKNYFRAFEQRSRWVRDELLLVGELGDYEDRLIEEWRIIFEQKRDELGDTATEEAKQKAAKAVYQWVESETHRLIRPGCTEPAIARGTYQMLADKPEDKPRVVWHVDFPERLKELIQTRGEL